MKQLSRGDKAMRQDYGTSWVVASVEKDLIGIAVKVRSENACPNACSIQ